MWNNRISFYLSPNWNSQGDINMSTKIKFLPVGNGDTTLFENGETTILTDLNHRTSKEDDQDFFDVHVEVREACQDGRDSYKLDYFVITHPDQDHIRGFDEVFYVGDPSKYSSRSAEKKNQVLIEEIWVSPYMEDFENKQDSSESVFKEVKRRLDLSPEEQKKSGNRIKVLEYKKEKSFTILKDDISYLILAPTKEESNIDKSTNDNGDRKSSNDSSLVILWKFKEGTKEAKVLIGGDAGVNVWNRIYDDFKHQLSSIEHHILLSPHHCSRTAMAIKIDETDYDYSENAKRVLKNFSDDGFVISSSKEILDDDDNPPSHEAKQEYLKMLIEKKEHNHTKRFLNPDTHDNNKPGKVVFELNESGLRLLAKSSISVTKTPTTQTYG
jgi:hypothetical protein